MVCAVFGFGVTEMVLVAFVAILLFPPRELPKIAREIARLYGYARRTADQFRSAILEDEELNKPIREIRNIYHETRYELRRAEELAQREMAKVRMEARMAARGQDKATNKPAAPPADAGGDGEQPPNPLAAAATSASDASVAANEPATASDAGVGPATSTPPSPSGSSPAPNATAGDPDAPPPRLMDWELPNAPRVPPPAPTLRKPTASVPRGTVTPHGAPRMGADASAPRMGDAHAPNETTRLDAEAHEAAPSRDDSAAGAA
jgi:Sec-independent protein translocase protein TatA